MRRIIERERENSNLDTHSRIQLEQLVFSLEIICLVSPRWMVYRFLSSKHLNAVSGRNFKKYREAFEIGFSFEYFYLVLFA